MYRTVSAVSTPPECDSLTLSAIGSRPSFYSPRFNRRPVECRPSVAAAIDSGTNTALRFKASWILYLSNQEGIMFDYLILQQWYASWNGFFGNIQGDVTTTRRSKRRVRRQKYSSWAIQWHALEERTIIHTISQTYLLGPHSLLIEIMIKFFHWEIAAVLVTMRYHSIINEIQRGKEKW